MILALLKHSNSFMPTRYTKYSEVSLYTDQSSRAASVVKELASVDIGDI